jgi:MurNAc alpha-1-phosphate uridylyltransferase
MTKITQSFIFAAGRGQRMRPITDNVPKPLIKVKSRPIIDYIVEKIDKISQIDKIIINGFYLSEQISDYITQKQNPKIIFSQEDQKIETGGALLFAIKKGLIDINSPILSANGDVIWQEKESSDIEKLIDFHQNNDSHITLGLTKTSNFIGYDGKGDFEISSNNEVSSPNGPRPYTFIGLQIIDPQILRLCPCDSFSMSYFYKNAKDLGIKIKGVELSSQFFHIGDPSGLDLAQNSDIIT